MSVDLSEFTATTLTPCKVRTVLAALPPEQSEKLDAALATPTITHQKIVTVLRNWGHKIGPHPVARHRAGECSCGA